MNPSALYASPNALAKDYKRFNVSERILLTGHSHQAWPDCSLQGQKNAWEDAANYVDDKWDKAFAKAELVRQGFRKLLDDDDGYISLGQNTHELVVRFLSALSLNKKPRIISTDGEFYSIRRQLTRLQEEGIVIERVESEPSGHVVEKIIQSIDDKTSAVLVSTVFFHNAQILPGLPELALACEKHGVKLLIDVYHQLNVVPFSIKEMNLQNTYVIGGGYKYCQLGEGVCFLRFPKDCDLRPVVTGWFAEFDTLGNNSHNKKVQYDNGNNRFAGATYDPTSHYRAVEVFDYFSRKKLTPQLLREVSQHQNDLLISRFDEADLDPKIICRNTNIKLNQIAGFLVFKSKLAKTISEKLKQDSVFTDVRGEILRLGPAPYLSDAQLSLAIDKLSKICRTL